ncbi:MAG: hypothetical protein K2K22_03480 [Muribaculaceae bacterium]|nr:hypothetical protein [Muribaculaceae bacterium]
MFQNISFSILAYKGNVFFRHGKIKGLTNNSRRRFCSAIDTSQALSATNTVTCPATSHDASIKPPATVPTEPSGNSTFPILAINASNDGIHTINASSRNHGA